MRAVHLRTDYLDRPLGLGNPTPRFYWQCEGGVRQTSYLIVAKRNGEVVWDSGNVASSSMTHIKYGGKPLGSRDIVDWSITLRDENGEAGEPAESSFELGLLSLSDWKAKWITGNYKPKKNTRYPVDCFRTKFEVKGDIVRARLYATARGIYDVTVNGTRLEDFILAPGMTDYRRRIQYQTYDVTALISGKNTIELRLADGWYRGSSAAYGVVNVYGTETSVMAQLEITIADGSVQTVCTDGTWEWSNDGAIRFADLKDGEVYDASMQPSYSGTAKVTAQPKDAEIVSSDNVYVTEHEHFKAKRLPNNVLDFGQNIAGYLEFTVKGKKGQKIKLVLGEVLDRSGNVYLKGIQETRPLKGWNQLNLIKKLLTDKVSGEAVGTPLQEITFICSGNEDHYKTSFAIFGFRYVQLDTDIDIDAESIAIYSDMEQTGNFACSNQLVNKLFMNTLWSMKGNFLDIPTDCPTRERLGWTGDAQIFFNTGAYLMDIPAFVSKWLRDMEDAQYQNGLLPAVLPYQGVEMMYKSTGSSVGWADAVYLIPWRYYKRYGDIELLRHCYPMIKKFSDYLISNLGMRDKKEGAANPYNAYTYEKGIHLGEWLEPDEFRDKVYGTKAKHPEECTAYLYLAVTTISEIAELCGDIEYCEKLKAFADGAKTAYNALFVEKGLLDTDRQAKIVRPLALGLLDGNDKKNAVDRLVKAVTDYRFRVGTGFLSTPFVLPVLSDNGRADIAYKMLENTEKPGWLGEVKDGATTIWENWEGNLSQNHYSPGAVCEWLFDTAAGIRPDGENRFIIKPVTGGTLTFAEASYQSLYGKVTSRWERSSSETVYTIEIPANTAAAIILPDGEKTVSAGKYEYRI